MMAESAFQQALDDILRDRPDGTPYIQRLLSMPTGQIRGRAVMELHAVAAITLALRGWATCDHVFVPRWVPPVGWGSECEPGGRVCMLCGYALSRDLYFAAAMWATTLPTRERHGRPTGGDRLLGASSLLRRGPVP